jgi:arsenite methyltransferase
MDGMEGYWTRQILDGSAVEGETYEVRGERFVFRDGILRQLRHYSDSQGQTAAAFGFKWQRRDTYESDHVQSFVRQWLLERYCQGREETLDHLIPPGARVLDAGCGSGHSALLFFGDRLRDLQYLGVDISAAVDVAQERFREAGLPGEFLQASFTALPFDRPAFDVIFAEGTLHHTDSTRGALESLARLLAPGGHLMFYVYRKKGPVREFTDDYLRDALQEMDDAAAWDALLPLTKLGRALGDLRITVAIPEEIQLLGIPAGPIDLQRFFYWHIMKAFYRPEMSIEEMNHVNFDWFRPTNAHRQTPEQVREWCEALRLTIRHMDVQEAGITVIASRAHG